MDQKIFIPLEDKDVFHIYMEETNRIYIMLACPPVHVDENLYAHTSLYDIILDVF